MSLRAGLVFSLLFATAAVSQEPARPMTLDEFLAPEPADQQPADATPAEPLERLDPTAAEPAPPTADPPASDAPDKPKTLLEALEAAGLDPHTKVANGEIQIMMGQRAMVRFDAKVGPVLEAVETGKLAAALPPGEAETYKGSGPNRLAVALDSSPARRESYMKIWNGLTVPIGFELKLSAVRNGQLMHKNVEACAVPSGKTYVETWPDPIVAVTLIKLAPAPTAAPCT